MTRRLILTLLLTAVLPAVGLATPREREYRLHPKDVAANPRYVQPGGPSTPAVRATASPASSGRTPRPPPRTPAWSCRGSWPSASAPIPTLFPAPGWPAAAS